MKKYNLILGAFAIMVALALNLRHTFNEYGILDNKLQVSVLAQSNGSSGGGGTTAGGGTTNGGSSSGGDSSGNGGSTSEKNCFNGGMGSSSCSISAGVNIVGWGATKGCTVTCISGYYACCSIRCTCVKL